MFAQKISDIQNPGDNTALATRSHWLYQDDRFMFLLSDALHFRISLQGISSDRRQHLLYKHLKDYNFFEENLQDLLQDLRPHQNIRNLKKQTYRMFVNLISDIPDETIAQCIHTFIQYLRRHQIFTALAVHFLKLWTDPIYKIGLKPFTPAERSSIVENVEKTTGTFSSIILIEGAKNLSPIGFSEDMMAGMYHKFKPAYYLLAIGAWIVAFINIYSSFMYPSTSWKNQLFALGAIMFFCYLGIQLIILPRSQQFKMINNVRSLNLSFAELFKEPVLDLLLEQEHRHQKSRQHSLQELTQAILPPPENDEKATTQMQSTSTAIPKNGTNTPADAIESKSEKQKTHKAPTIDDALAALSDEPVSTAMLHPWEMDPQVVNGRKLVPISDLPNNQLNLSRAAFEAKVPERQHQYYNSLYRSSCDGRIKERGPGLKYLSGDERHQHPESVFKARFFEKGGPRLILRGDQSGHSVTHTPGTYYANHPK